MFGSTYRSAVARIFLLLFLLSATAGCSRKLVTVAAIPDTLAFTGERVPIHVVCEIPDSLSNYICYYTSSRPNADFAIGDALTSYANRVAGDCFESDDLCPANREPGSIASTILVPNVLQATNSVSSFGNWSDETTETVVRWTMMDEQGKRIWSKAYAGTATGGMGWGWSIIGNTSNRHADSISSMYLNTCKGITTDPVLWRYAYCFPLLNLAEGQQLDAAHDILDRAKTCDRFDEAADAVLIFASSEGSIPLMELLASEGVEIDAPFRFMDETALGLAITHDHFDLADKLLTKGADIDRTDRQGRTLLFKAALREDDQALSYLADRDARFVPVDTCGFTALASARAFEHLADSADAANRPDAAAERRARSAEYYAIAADHFQDMANDFKSRKSSLARTGFLKKLALGLAVTAVQAGEAYNARVDAEHNAEIMALHDASNSGAGLEGYYANVGSYRRAARQEADRNIAFAQANDELLWQQAMRDSEQATNTKEGLESLIEKYSTLADLCRQEAGKLETGK